MCCTRLAANTGRQKIAKIRHLRTKSCVLYSQRCCTALEQRASAELCGVASFIINPSHANAVTRIVKAVQRVMLFVYYIDDFIDHE